MIKFFRHIRQRLVRENRFSKYLLYAIGEIILVVIGILIALQINNWNENRKLKKSEIKLLENFKTSIEADTARVNYHINDFEGRNDYINILLRHIKADLPYHDSLSIYFMNSTAIWVPRLDQEVFATLTSTDLNIISDAAVKKEITSYYSFAKRQFDVFINRYALIIEDASKHIFPTRFNALWNNSYRDPDSALNGGRLMIPNDYEALKKDQEYLYFLRSQKNQLYWYVRSPLKEAKRRAEKLLTSLNEELSILQKNNSNKSDDPVLSKK
jgi:hypothetical protein